MYNYGLRKVNYIRLLALSQSQRSQKLHVKNIGNNMLGPQKIGAL